MLVVVGSERVFVVPAVHEAERVGTRQPRPPQDGLPLVAAGDAAGARPAGVGPHDPGRAAPPAGGGVGLYARVSWHGQRADLDRQVARLSQWAATAGVTVVRVEAEVASGMNGHRPKLRRLLADPSVQAVVVEHRDRLARMNAELVEAALAAAGRRLVVVEAGEVDHDLVRDVVEVLTSFCARRYGRRSARHRR
jgi:putative resolvase